MKCWTRAVQQAQQSAEGHRVEPTGQMGRAVRCCLCKMGKSWQQAVSERCKAVKATASLFMLAWSGKQSNHRQITDPLA